MSNSISPSQAFEITKSLPGQSVLVDVRSGSEFSSLHAQPAVHIPLEAVSNAETVERLKGKKVLCICQSGMRGKKAVEALRNLGLDDVANVEGGTAAWNAANLPVVKGQGSISIERQVRIVAGSLVVLSTLGGLYLFPAMFGLTLFVGLGLVFAGVTDTCAMAILLARCPWNR